MHSKESIKELQSNYKELAELGIQDRKKDNNIAKLCLPARYKLPWFKSIFENQFGDYLAEIDKTIQAADDHNGRGLAAYKLNNKKFSADLDSFLGKGADSHLHIFGITRRHFNEHGRIFSLTPQLIDRLIDSGPPSKDISTSQLRLPYSSMFLEFGHAADRETSKLRTHYSGINDVIIEGTYISEIEADAKYNSQEMKEHFGLVTNSAYRILELGISLSPLSFIDTELKQSAFEGQPITYVMLCIPAEDMSLRECIDLNASWLKNDSTLELINLVYNALLYINLDSRVSKTIAMPKESVERLNQVKNPVKKRKAACEIAKQYGHIQLGSTQPYITVDSLKDKFKDIHTGKNRPHPRRGYFAPRVMKTEDGDKIKRVTWIKNCIINKHLLPKDELEMIERQYNII